MRWRLQKAGSVLFLLALEVQPNRPGLGLRRRRPIAGLRRWTALCTAYAVLLAAGETLFLHRHEWKHGRHADGEPHQQAEGFHAHVPHRSGGLERSPHLEALLPDSDDDDALYLSWFHAGTASKSHPMPCLIEERRIVAPTPQVSARTETLPERIHDPPLRTALPARSPPQLIPPFDV